MFMHAPCRVTIQYIRQSFTSDLHTKYLYTAWRPNIVFIFTLIQMLTLLYFNTIVKHYPTHYV